MLEFIIASTAVLLILFGILEFARVLFIYHSVSDAARIGARWAIVRGADCSAVLDHCNAEPADVQSYVQSIVPMLSSSTLTVPGCSNPGLCVTTTWSTGTGPGSACDQNDSSGYNAMNHVVCVTVQYPFNFAIPFVSSTLLTLSSSSQMIIAN
jgi:Flp pilus assembly protein TadG